MTHQAKGWTGLASGIALIAGLSAPATAETLLMNNWLPPTHSLVTEVFEPWAAEVARATGGDVDIRMTDSSLGAPPRQFDLALDGIADITFGVTGYTPGRFQLPAIAELPQVGAQGEALSVALWQTYEEMFADAGEFEEVKLLGLFANGTGVIMSTESTGPVTSITQYEGRKFRVGGGVVQDINTAIGGVNVAAPAGEVYEILEQGVADGVLLPTDAYKSFNLTGVIDYVTTVPGGFYTSAWFLVMNQSKWDSLSAENQQAVMSVSGEVFARMAGKAQDAGDRVGLDQMAADGVKITEASREFVSAIQQRVAPIEQDWITSADEMGIDGTAALAKFRSITSEIESGK